MVSPSSLRSSAAVKAPLNDIEWRASKAQQQRSADLRLHRARANGQDQRQAAGQGSPGPRAEPKAATAPVLRQAPTRRSPTADGAVVYRSRK